LALNWDDMRVFLAVARGGSLSTAAWALKVTQPTAGPRVRALEAALSARLFDRLPQGLVLTAAGGKLLPLAEAMERSAEAAARRQASLADRVTGTVRISPGEVTAQFVTVRLTELWARLPEIEIELVISHLLANLSRREADLVIRECLPDSAGLVARRLGTISLAVYGARSLVERNSDALGEGCYRDCPWVSFDEEHNYFPEQKWLLEKLGGRQTQVRVKDALVLFDALRSGAGLGVLSCFAGGAAPGLLRMMPPLQEVVSLQHLIVHPDLRRVPSVRVVMDELLALFARSAESLAGLAPPSQTLRTA